MSVSPLARHVLAPRTPSPSTSLATTSNLFPRVGYDMATTLEDMRVSIGIAPAFHQKRTPVGSASFDPTTGRLVATHPASTFVLRVNDSTNYTMLIVTVARCTRTQRTLFFDAALYEDGYSYRGEVFRFTANEFMECGWFMEAPRFDDARWSIVSSAAIADLSDDFIRGSDTETDRGMASSHIQQNPVPAHSVQHDVCNMQSSSLSLS